MTLRITYALALLSGALEAAAQGIQQTQFNQVINLNGDMILNSMQFPDGSRVETFSQTQRQMLVNQNQAPLPGNQVTGTTGNPFMQLSTNSLVIQTNGATDLVAAQIELPINTQMLQQSGITPDNTFVAKLAQDRQSWTIDETIKTVNNTDNTVRIVKMNNIDGEYIALGRQTPVTGQSLTPFGNAQTNNFNVSGSGIQENEFADGFRMSVRATQPTIINMDVTNGISTTMLSALPPGTQSVNNYRYRVTTNLGGVVSNINRMAAVMQIPINPQRLQAVAQGMGAGAQSNVRLAVAQRGILTNPGGAQGNIGGNIGQKKRQNNPQASPPLNGQQPPPPPPQNGQQPPQNGQQPPQNGQTNNGQIGTGTINNNPAATSLLLSPTFTPIQANAVLDTMQGRLAIPVSQVDGEYIITVSMGGAGGQQGGQGQLQNGQQGQLQNGQQGQLQNGQQGGLQGGAQPVQGEPQGVAQPRPSQGLREPAAQPIPGEPQGVAQPIPQEGAARQPTPQEGARQPAGAPIAGQPARPINEPALAAPPAREPLPPAVAAPAPSVAIPATGSFITKRQLPPLPQSQADGSVLVSMEWINYMADIQRQGGAINVGAMMAQVAPGLAQATTLGGGSAGAPNIASLLGTVKARKFKA